MATKRTTPKKASPLAKGTTKRARSPGESRATASRSKRTADTHKGTSPVNLLDIDPSLAERVESERDRIFKAVSIVLCCWYATVTKWAVDDHEYMIPAFEAVCDLLNDSAEELERIASACEKLGATSRPIRMPVE